MRQSLLEDKPPFWLHKTNAPWSSGEKDTAHHVGRAWLEARTSSWEPVLGEKMMSLQVQEGGEPLQAVGGRGPDEVL